jgi:tetratricopeptide (TPR) repeat protein
MLSGLCSPDALLLSCPHPHSFVPSLLLELRNATEAVCTASSALNSKSVSVKIIDSLSKVFARATTTLDCAAPPPGQHLYKVGERIILQGLKQRPDLNGCCGVVRSAFDQTDGVDRIEVSVGSGKSKQSLSVRPSNMRLEWHVAADVHVAVVGQRAMLRILGSALSGRICCVESLDPSTSLVSLTAVKDELSEEADDAARSPAFDVVHVSDIVPAAYFDVVDEVHRCALKVVLMQGSHIAVPAVNVVMRAVKSGADFCLRCSRFDEAVRVLVSVLNLLHTSTRSSLTMSRIHVEDYKKRTMAFIEMCHDVVDDLQKIYNQFDAACALVVECKDVCEDIEGQDSLIFASELRVLAGIYQKLNRLADAETLLNRAMQILTLKFGRESLEISETLNNLALVLSAQDRIADAEALFRESILIKEREYGRDSLKVASLLKNLAYLLFENFSDRYEEVESMYQEILRIEGIHVGPDSLEVGMTTNSLGLMYEKQGRFSDAERMFRESLRVRQLVLGHESLLVAKTMCNVAGLLVKMNRFADAEEFRKEVVRIKKMKLGCNSLEVAAALQLLASLYEKQDRLDDAQAAFKEALQIQQQKTGHESLEVCRTLEYLCCVYEKQLRIPDAVAACKEVLRLKEMHFGHESIEVANSMNNLAVIYFRYYSDRLGDAEAMYKETMRIGELQVGHDSENVALTLENLGLMHEKQGRLAEAEALYSECLRIYESKLGHDAPETESMRDRLAVLYPPVLSDISVCS